MTDMTLMDKDNNRQTRLKLHWLYKW